nr:hypothetical protein [Tanacetum cinerariifolium]
MILGSLNKSKRLCDVTIYYRFTVSTFPVKIVIRSSAFILEYLSQLPIRTGEIHKISFVTKEDISKTLPCQLPPKEINPGSFTLPYTIGNLTLYAMADLGVGVNVTPKSLFEHLKLVDLKETSMVVEMADMKKKSPLGIGKNILVKIDKFLFHFDFVVIDMLEGLNVTMLLEYVTLEFLLKKITWQALFKKAKTLTLLKLKNEVFSYDSPVSLLLEQEPLDLVHHYLIEVHLRDGSRVKDVVQHEPYFILEIVDNGFGSLAMRALMNLRFMRLLVQKRLIKRNEEKVKALGANGEVSGFGVRVVWMVVDGGTVRAKLVDVNKIRLGHFLSRILGRGVRLDATEYDDQDKWNEEDDLQFFHRTKHHGANMGPREEEDKCQDNDQQHTGEMGKANRECTHKPLDKEL